MGSASGTDSGDVSETISLSSDASKPNASVEFSIAHTHLPCPFLGV